MANTYQNSHIPAHIHMYVNTSWPHSFSLLFLAKNILVFTHTHTHTHTHIHTHTPLYIEIFMNITTFVFLLFVQLWYRKNCFAFFNILVFVNFSSSTFVSTNCIVYCGTGIRIYILEKYSFLHTDFSDSRPSLLKAEVANRVACHVFLIFQTKRMNAKKNLNKKTKY